ncbi:MAG: 30S ribosomal protein S3 [Patescibacteria group bacterium]
MGQKVNPTSMRLKINETWKSLWFGGQNYTDYLISDLKIRELLSAKLKDASVSSIIISRDANKVTIDIHSARPGVIIGRGGAGTDELKKLLQKKLVNRVQINIVEVKKPDADAAIIAQNVASAIERRVPFRRAMKQSIEKAREAGVKGIKIVVGGRLNGADIARSEKNSYGTVPLSVFKNNIEYKHIQAHTTFGVIGVKVWVFKGEKKEIK